MSGTHPKVAVLGAGAVGCYFGGMLARAGVPVTLIGRPAHVEAINRRGLVIERDAGGETIRVAAATGLEAARGADIVLVCVKSSDTAEAARALREHVDPDAVAISLQNGVDNARRLRAVLANPVLAAVVYVGCSIEGPGIVRHAGRGDLVIGAARADASRPDTAQRLASAAAMFESAGVACPVSPDIDAALWTKLAINCAFNAISALGRSRYGRMACTPSIRPVMEDAACEAAAVARAEGIALDDSALVGQVWQVATAMAGQFSSTAQDVLRGKRTEIDALNGYVAARAAELGLDAPVNRTLHALVRLREAGDDLASGPS